MSDEIYIPTDAITLDKVGIPNFRIGIQGVAGEGKTWAAATFAEFFNTIFLSLDRGLGAHTGRKDIAEVRMYLPEVVDKYSTRVSGGPPNTRDAILKWLDKEGAKLTNKQVLVPDGLSDIESAFDRQIELEPVLTDRGVRDSFADWRRKIKYFDELFTKLKSLSCNIILISHEQVERNTKGDLTGKARPLLTGQAADRIVKNFTDWFRQLALDKKPRDKVTPESLKLWGMKSVEEFMKMQDEFPGNTIYCWQTESGDDFSAKSSSLVNVPRFIPANWKSFRKYMRISPDLQKS